MSSITNGGYYVIKDMMTGKYSKVRIVHIEDNEYTYTINGGKFTEYDIHVHFVILKGGWESSKYVVPFSDFNSRRVKRKPNCRKCQRDLDEYKMDICEDCGWIKCPDDNACGCGWVNEQGA
ncbi:hypothetical protein [Bacillus thuringiensis]|uniref:hypothetical protein n=1 Tax=Bacillus thuringiensis TaxID=1428 RepID=UPI000D580176|nr:hypothetical protein [Bacillus thuringiensis]MBD8075449.1 hypothetical protein [Bacillus thuringiensis]MCU5036437.1 hypothetical protein [Bacillus cereus]